MIVLDPDLDLPAAATPAPSASRKKPPAKRSLSPDPPKRVRLQPAPPQPDIRERIPYAPTLARFLSSAQAAVRLRGQVTVLLTTDTAIRRLNRRFRGKNKATDVLSFPADQSISRGVAGDLAISVPMALRQAREHGHRLATEIKVLILHGLLHLTGLDHETDSGQMARRELRLRRRLNLPHGLIERAHDPDPVQKSAPQIRPKPSPTARKAAVAKRSRS